MLLYKYMVLLFFITLLIFLRVKKKAKFNLFFYLSYAVICSIIGISLFRETIALFF